MTVIINNVFLQRKIWINYSAQLFIHNLHSVYNVMVQFKTAPKSILLIKQKLLLEVKSYCLSIFAYLTLKKILKKEITDNRFLYTDYNLYGIKSSF